MQSLYSVPGEIRFLRICPFFMVKNYFQSEFIELSLHIFEIFPLNRKLFGSIPDIVGICDQPEI